MLEESWSASSASSSDQEMQNSLRDVVLGAVAPAVERLARAARGEPAFETVEQMRSCFLLARLAAVVLGDRPARARQSQLDQQPQDIKLDDEQRRLLEQLEAPFYGPPQLGAAHMDDPNRQPPCVPWGESCRRAGLDPREVSASTNAAFEEAWAARKR